MPAPKVVLTPKQQHRRALIERRLRAALKDAETLAVEVGYGPGGVHLHTDSGTWITMNDGTNCCVPAPGTPGIRFNLNWRTTEQNDE